VQEVQRGARGPAPEGVDELPDVAIRQRHDGGVEGRGGRALVLPELRVDVARDGDVGEVTRERGLESPLVGGVRVAVEQADGHALHALLLEGLHDGGELVHVERDQDGAVGADALGHL